MCFHLYEESKIVKLRETDGRFLFVKHHSLKFFFDWGFGIGICMLLVMEWMLNRDLLYSTGNSIFCDNLYGKRL